MRDDDGSFDEDPPAGNLYYSGIQSEDEIEPAEYALPPGVAALQDELLEESDEPLDEFEEPLTESENLNRRRFLALALGGIAIGTGSFFSGWSLNTATQENHPSQRRRSGTRLTQDDLLVIETARGWAGKPIGKLVAASSSFLWVFNIVEPDETLCEGLRKLCDYADVHRGEEMGRLVAVRILRTFNEVPPPPGFENELRTMEDVIVQWETSKERKRR